MTSFLSHARLLLYIAITTAITTAITITISTCSQLTPISNAACNPKYAHRGLVANSDLGLLLPCNVVVQQTEDGQFKVSAINPKVMTQAIDDTPEIAELSIEVYDCMNRVIQSLKE